MYIAKLLLYIFPLAPFLHLLQSVLQDRDVLFL